MTDALGNEIQIGQTYGYSMNNNGVTNIKVGEALKINEKSVTLEIIYFKTALWVNDPTDPTFPAKTNKISVKGNLLFPVDKNLIN